MMKRVIVATLSMAMSTLLDLPALARNERFESERQETMNKLNDRFESEQQETLNK